MTNKVVLVPMEKVGWSKGDILKCVKTKRHNCIAAENNSNNAMGIWQPQQLLIVSDESPIPPEWVYDYERNIVRFTSSHFGITDFDKKIIAAYPKIEDGPTIQLSDIQEMERKGWPDSLDVEIDFITKGPIVDGDQRSIVINWGPTVSKPEIVEGVMTAAQWFDTTTKAKHSTFSAMKGYAEYYHAAMTEQAKNTARNEPKPYIEALREKYDAWIFNSTNLDSSGSLSEKIFAWFAENIEPQPVRQAETTITGIVVVYADGGEERLQVRQETDESGVLHEVHAGEWQDKD